MQFNANREHRLKDNSDSFGSKEDGTHATQYPYPIHFYTTPPFGKISLEECDDLVNERLNLLKVFEERLTSVENKKQNNEAIESALKNSFSKFDKNFYVSVNGSEKSVETVNARRRDHISHFLLRIYYSRSEELRKWFIASECEFFRHRLMDIVNKTNELPQILDSNGFYFEQISDTERTAMFALINWDNTLMFSTMNVVYRLPIEEALDLVRLRKVYVNNGYAYVMAQDMVSVIVNIFRSDLSQSLAKMQLYLSQLNEDERLIPRLHSIHVHVVENRKLSKSDDSELVTPEMIDELAKESFPPCMRNIHEMLRKDHHLRHYGRLHYGLFLKSIGLSLDDAMRFFRDEFIQKITPEKFQRDYAYNIRYNYGKEGKKINISAYSCNKIINDNSPGPTDTHGCPFRHFDKKNLHQLLHRYGVDDFNTQQILKIVEEKNYTNACCKYFSVKHHWYPQLEQNIYHPNQYFSESRKAIKLSILSPPESIKESKSQTDCSDLNEINLNDEQTKLDETISNDNQFNSLMEISSDNSAVI